jgi:import inner membrane translocase subunit TIM10
MFRNNRPSHELIQAELNMELFVELQSQSIETCRKRCINPDYKFDQMSKAESSCIDRCIVKFFETNRLVQELGIEEIIKKQQGI